VPAGGVKHQTADLPQDCALLYRVRNIGAEVGRWPTTCTDLTWKYIHITWIIRQLSKCWIEVQKWYVNSKLITFQPLSGRWVKVEGPCVT